MGGLERAPQASLHRCVLGLAEMDATSGVVSRTGEEASHSGQASPWKGLIRGRFDGDSTGIRGGIRGRFGGDFKH